MSKPSPPAVILSMITLSIFARVNCPAQDIPLVYEFEQTGSDLPKPVLPDFDQLPTVRPLPDPFAWSNGSGRSTQFEDWARRRAETFTMAIAG
ncbi:hypothetical protein Enr13x_25070 [Stieleria neptunia]|uniref:Acetylxylan esterase n=1 Tax=Stieleria neptunia TaxID=2527979 RepID=A0A518HP89_9BACT|nr:hypothetical protein [Stieleria neptunia]QDV42658.1 hypothetical protein Enr13x_25070 [Stieleria neptunia]